MCRSRRERRRRHLVQALLKAVEAVNAALVLRRDGPSLESNVTGVHGRAEKKG